MVVSSSTSKMVCDILGFVRRIPADEGIVEFSKYCYQRNSKEYSKNSKKRSEHRKCDHNEKIRHVECFSEYAGNEYYSFDLLDGHIRDEYGNHDIQTKRRNDEQGRNECEKRAQERDEIRDHDKERKGQVPRDGYGEKQFDDEKSYVCHYAHAQGKEELRPEPFF